MPSTKAALTVQLMHRFSSGAACGTCIAYRGCGQGSGTDVFATNVWTYELITDECPECLHGALDKAKSGGGSGRFTLECESAVIVTLLSISPSGNARLMLPGKHD